MLRSFAETLKQCGGDAWWFVVALPPVVACAGFWERGGQAAFAGLLLILVVRVFHLISRQRPGRWEYTRFPPLSQHDWRAARSKLVKQQNGR
jgi:hypothetical protein